MGINESMFVGLRTAASVAFKESDVVPYGDGEVVLISDRPVILAQPTLTGLLSARYFGLHSDGITRIDGRLEPHPARLHIGDHVGYKPGLNKQPVADIHGA